jgi:type IV secretory pathway VirB2 component (pilin)
LPLLILLPIYLYERGNKTLATFCIILGTGFKYFPILLAPLIWIYSKDWKKRSMQTLLFLIGLTTTSLPFYLIAPSAFINQFKNPIVSPRNQGLLTLIQDFISTDINQYNLIIQIVTMCLILLAGLFFFLKKDDWKYHKTIVFLIIFFVFYPKIQVSYFAMIIPFTSICLFTEGKIKWTFLIYYIFGISLGVATDYLLADTHKILYLEVICWIVIGLFYLTSLLFILYFLFINKRNGTVKNSEKN